MRNATNGGVAVDVRQVKEVTDLSAYRAVVVGSAVHGGKWMPEAVEFVQANQSRLSQVPTAYFLVCITMARDTEGNRRTVSAYLEPVRTLVKPVAEGWFAGALWPGNFPNIPQRAGVCIWCAFLGVLPGDQRNWGAIRAWADSIRPLLLA